MLSTSPPGHFWETSSIHNTPNSSSSWLTLWFVVFSMVESQDIWKIGASCSWMHWLRSRGTPSQHPVLLLLSWPLPRSECFSGATSQGPGDRSSSIEIWKNMRGHVCLFMYDDVRRNGAAETGKPVPKRSHPRSHWKAVPTSCTNKIQQAPTRKALCWPSSGPHGPHG